MAPPGTVSNGVDDFDPYLAWLDIGRHEHPISDRRLLGLRADESDPQVIAAAVAKVLTHLLQYAAGVQGNHCRRLTIEVAAARDRLLPSSRGATPSVLSPQIQELQIKPPPPVPTSADTTAAPERPITQSAAKVPSTPPAATELTKSMPHVPAARAVTAGAATPPDKSNEAQSATPVGLPLGQPVAAMSVAEVAAPPAVVTVNVPTGKSAASETGDGERLADVTISAHRFRRGSRNNKGYFWATMAVGGICLLLLLIVLLIVALNS